MADRSARGGDRPADQILGRSDGRAIFHQDRQRLGRLVGGCLHRDRLDRAAALIGEDEGRVGGKAKVRGATTDRFQQRLGGGKFRPFDLVGGAV